MSDLAHGVIRYNGAGQVKLPFATREEIKVLDNRANRTTESFWHKFEAYLTSCGFDRSQIDPLRNLIDFYLIGEMLNRVWGVYYITLQYPDHVEPISQEIRFSALHFIEVQYPGVVEIMSQSCVSSDPRDRRPRQKLPEWTLNYRGPRAH